jgi:hypothetical protein
MLRDEVWAAAAPDNRPDGDSWMLCVGCVERRLGRLLVPADFDWTLSLNTESTIDSDRLLDRKGVEVLD